MAEKKKVSIWSKIAKFFRELRSELKKVVWFGRKATIQSTVLVTVVLVIASVVISMLDLGFSKALMALGRLI